MKKLLLVMIATAIATTATLAQDPAHKDHKKDKAEWEAKIKTELKLTSDQVAKFDAISKEYAPKFDAIAQDATLTQDVQKEKKEALKKEKEARLFEFFTPEQQTKYREIMERKKKEMTKPTGGS